ncbi:MAG: DUF4350 domain-containing protein [bacterium]
MTSPTDSPRTREWWTRPAVMLPIVGAVAVMVALITPQATSGRFGDARLSSHLAGSLGARVLHDMSVRLGWRAIRNDSLPAPVAPDGRTIHAVLAPTTPITTSEAHRYLDAVRGGDALLVVADQRNPLTDSLGVTHRKVGGIVSPYEPAKGECSHRLDMTPALWADGRVHLFGVRWLRNSQRAQIHFAPLAYESVQSSDPGDAAVGFSLGAGRVVVVGDPDMLRNDVLRHCAWGLDVIAVNMLEWLRAGGPTPRTTIAFDEYHQGFGSRTSVSSVTAEFLVDHPVGRALLGCVLAALVLLLAVSPRAVRPREITRIERRDPLEQVDALAHAYEQVRATRTITARLLRGLRWRVERGGAGARARADTDFLDAVVQRTPTLGTDVALVRRALGETIADRDLPEVGAALRRIEHTLTTTSS